MSSDCKYNYPQIARDSGFKLRQCRNGFLDWRLIGCLDVEKILEDQQFEKIDGALLYLSEAPLTPALEINVLDHTVGKYFFISQLAIQYLIFCRKFLDQSVKALRESLVKMELENNKLKALNQEHNDEIVQLHKKISQLEAINDIIFPCHICTKNFVSNDALNTHLIKKHSNNTNDFQIMSNDRTLINTIKLELEIKHLKERLNVAEKDIRETSETKRIASKKYTKVSSSTQIETVNVEIGTQCNLFESKEIDSATEGKNMQLFVSELQEKILELESWKEAHRFENKESINDITETLKQISDSIVLKQEQGFSNLKNIVDNSVLSLKSSDQIIPSSTKELQSFLSNTVSDLMQQNSRKLNTILNKIETIYEEKILNSQLRDNIKTQSNIQDISIDHLTMVEKAPPRKTDLHSNRNRAYNFEKPSINKCRLEDTSLDMSPPVMQLKNNTLTNEILKQELASYGVATSTNSISTIEVANISSRLMENRNNMQKKNSAFIATRNKLKSYVNNLCIKNSCNEHFHQHSLSALKLQFTTIKPPIPKKNESDHFKERLEKILCSPIKKPSIYDPSCTIDSFKPIPLPRKRVIFNPPPINEL